MHTKTHIKNFIASKIAQPIHYRDVEQMHKFFETYIKHMALTVLRLNGGKYQESRQYITKAWIPCSEEQLQKIILKLFNQKPTNKRYWQQLLAKNRKLRISIELVFSYAVRVRNLIFHGNYYPFKEGEEALLYQIYVKAIENIEQLISKQKNGRKILNHSPSEFGAPKGTLTRKNQLKNILRFQMAGLPYSFEKATQLYDTL